MPRSDFHDYVIHDLMSHIEGIQSRAMFGGWGLYKHSIVFGIIADDQVYFKVDDHNRKDYESARSTPFTYEAKGRKKITMSYWEVPVDVLEDREQLELWIDKACAAKLRSKKTKTKSLKQKR